MITGWRRRRVLSWVIYEGLWRLRHLKSFQQFWLNSQTMDYDRSPMSSKTWRLCSLRETASHSSLLTYLQSNLCPQSPGPTWTSPLLRLPSVPLEGWQWWILVTHPDVCCYLRMGRGYFICCTGMNVRGTKISTLNPPSLTPEVCTVSPLCLMNINFASLEF